ncbi:MAG: hypothetical protein R8G60_12815 [Roseovarius pacificus]|nr:hypothetical protein [Roseovarius pacificus]
MQGRFRAVERLGDQFQRVVMRVVQHGAQGRVGRDARPGGAGGDGAGLGPVTRDVPALGAPRQGQVQNPR